MAIESTDRYRGVCRISNAKFTSIVESRANPGIAAERRVGKYWEISRAYLVDPLFLLAMFHHESGMGRYGVATQTHSWGNVRRPNFGPVGDVGTVPGRTGVFPVFKDWLDGCVSTVARLTTPLWVYANRTQIREIFVYDGPVWAPGGDLNDPNGYLRAMLDFMNLHADMEEDIPSYRYFPETGHGVARSFKDHWESRGDHAIPDFGYPLSEEVSDPSGVVQYFERAVFEHHPNEPDPYKVQLRRLGAIALAQRVPPL